MEPIQAILAIVALVREGKLWEALPMVLRLIAHVIESLPTLASSAGVVDARPSEAPVYLGTPSDCCNRLEAIAGLPRDNATLAGVDLTPILRQILPVLLRMLDLIRQQLGI